MWCIYFLPEELGVGSNSYNFGQTCFTVDALPTVTILVRPV